MGAHGVGSGADAREELRHGRRVQGPCHHAAVAAELREELAHTGQVRLECVHGVLELRFNALLFGQARAAVRGHVLRGAGGVPAEVQAQRQRCCRRSVLVQR